MLFKWEETLPMLLPKSEMYTFSVRQNVDLINCPSHCVNKLVYVVKDTKVVHGIKVLNEWALRSPVQHRLKTSNFPRLLQPLGLDLDDGTTEPYGQSSFQVSASPCTVDIPTSIVKDNLLTIASSNIEKGTTV